jgi:hypothetical protein
MVPGNREDFVPFSVTCLRMFFVQIPTKNRHPGRSGSQIFCTAIAREKQLKGWRREKKLNLIGTINPEFKDLAQSWGWKMITVHEKMYP